ncbi:hypothetical protein E2C01_064925 [Portunus trituberculatus]|uniref:Uncharacterized protein n=1 Tax=Portunus trituberculatus TaxID=210409 RepID=A0A5B7HEC5_PORTR|nr:hypothetical protein [Portunus trituberculatus]
MSVGSDRRPRVGWDPTSITFLLSLLASYTGIYSLCVLSLCLNNFWVWLGQGQAEGVTQVCRDGRGEVRSG